MKLDTFSARNLGEAQALLQRNAFDLCLTDMRLPDGTGWTWCSTFSNVIHNCRWR
jgi:CheY-like chemotaxis protein